MSDVRWLKSWVTQRAWALPGSILCEYSFLLYSRMLLWFVGLYWIFWVENGKFHSPVMILLITLFRTEDQLSWSHTYYLAKSSAIWFPENTCAEVLKSEWLSFFFILSTNLSTNITSSMNIVLHSILIDIERRAEDFQGLYYYRIHSRFRNSYVT